MTEDVSLSVKRKKSNQDSKSPDKLKKKKKHIGADSSGDADLPVLITSPARKAKPPRQEGKEPNKNEASPKTARKKFEKLTGTKKISGSSTWNDLKKKKKELRLSRKKASKVTTYDDMVNVKKMWEKLRLSKCPPEEREKLITTIHETVQANLDKLVFTHDGARIVQWLLKMGAPPLRTIICDQLESLLPLMVRSKYATFCIRRMFKYGSSESHSKVIRSFYGHVVKFMCHIVAAPVVEFAYAQYATSAQKAALRQEFYGSMSQVAQPGEIHCLADVYKHTPELKDATLSATRHNILKVLNKQLAQSGLLHAVILDYLRTCPGDQPEILGLLQPILMDLLVSKEGSHLAMMCIWQGSVKERKAAIKLLKGKMKDVAMSVHGHWLLLAIFDCVDDTVLLNKALIPELLNDLVEIASNEYGRLVILYLIGHRDPLHFHPAVVKILQEGDTNVISKKDPAVRRAELLGPVCDSLLSSIAEEPHVWLASNSIAMVTLAALKYGVGKSLRQAFEALGNLVCDESNMMKFADNQCHAIEHSGVHFLLKKLIESDKDKDSSECFSSIFVSIIKPSTIDWWINCNRGCFILIMLLEKGSKEVKKRIKEKFSDKLLKTLESKKSVGAKILLQKLV